MRCQSNTAPPSEVKGSSSKTYHFFPRSFPSTFSSLLCSPDLYTAQANKMVPLNITEISRSELGSPSEKVSVTDVTHLSSYNWIEASAPTIAVPGSSAPWTPPKAFQNQVKEDKGLPRTSLVA
ncbi:hypothetical protein BJX76DRAFT_325081 [Aspergillus varians]